MKKLLLPLLLCSSLLFADKVETRTFSIENNTQDEVKVILKTPAVSGNTIDRWYAEIFPLKGYEQITLDSVRMINNDQGTETDYYSLTVYSSGKTQRLNFNINGRTKGIKCKITSGLKLSCFPIL